MHDREVLDITIERHGTGGQQWFTVHCTGTTTVKGGRIVYTERGKRIQERLRAAFPTADIAWLNTSQDGLTVKDGIHSGWSDVRSIDLYRVILQWEPLFVESGPGPHLREIQMRTSRPLYEREVALLQSELHLVATLVIPNYGGSPLYRIVPELGKPTVANTVLLRFLYARNASRG